MRSLLRLLIVVLVFGTAVQQGWLQAGARFVSGLFGAHPALAPREEGMAGSLLDGFSGLLDHVLGLPDPRYTLTLMVAGVIGVILLVTLVRTAGRLCVRPGGGPALSRPVRRAAGRASPWGAPAA